MKIRDILLLEYRRDVTLRSFGKRLLDRYTQETGDTSASADDVIAQIEQGDPTPNQQYVPWIVREYISGGIRRMEDVKSRVRPALTLYHQNKRMSGFPAEARDINRINTDQLYDITERFKPAQKEDTDRGRFKTIIDNHEVRVIQPMDEKAACYYGRGTRWCTAARENNMFSHYHDQGPLYIFLPKTPKYTGEKYQIHAESDQFMNERDTEVDLVELIKRFPSTSDFLHPMMVKIHNDYPLLSLTDDDTLDKIAAAIRITIEHSIPKIRDNMIRVNMKDYKTWIEDHEPQEDIQELIRNPPEYLSFEKFNTKAARELNDLKKFSENLTGSWLKQKLLTVSKAHRSYYLFEVLCDFSEWLQRLYVDSLISAFFWNCIIFTARPQYNCIRYKNTDVAIPNTNRTMFVCVDSNSLGKLT